MANFSATIRIRTRTDGTSVFDVRYRQDGHSRSVSFVNARKAEQWAAIVRKIGPAEALALLRDRDSAGGPTLDVWAERYIASLSGVEGKTTDDYRLYMRVSISPTLGSLPIDAISSQRIAEWINLQAQTYASKTIKNRHGFLSAMLQAAVDEDLLAKNPCANSRLPESEQREMVFLSPTEYFTILEYVPDHFRLVVELLAATGMRFGEVTALRPGDFDWHHMTVRISRAWKSSRDRGWYIGAPKTKRSRRTVSLPQSLLPRLRAHAAATQSEWMFVNRHGGPIRQQRFWDDVWAPARRLANGQAAFPPKRDRNGKVHTAQPRRFGSWDKEPAAEPIGKWPRVHDLRHTHASWLIADGIPLVTIQRRLGHESITTTMDRYGHLSPDLIQQPADSMDRLMAREPVSQPALDLQAHP